MRFLMRLFGTWFLGAALILIIIDGTKSLAANGLMTTSLAETWMSMHAQSFDTVTRLAADNGLSAVWAFVNSTVLGWPGFLVVGIPGLLLAFLGRSRTSQIRNIGQI